MKTIYFDLSMGAAGDMMTAALLELHDDPKGILEILNNIFAGKAVLSVQKDQKCGITGSHVTVTIDGQVEGEINKYEHHLHTSISEVREFIGSLDIPERVIQDALTVYDLIAEAEAHVHGHPLDNIHFHEVGSLDAMVDVVSVCYLIYNLKLDCILASPIHVGSGTVRCTHGELPVPAPATQEILKGIPIYSGDIPCELCTPTGAALLKHFVAQFGNMPLIRVTKVGYGTGLKEFSRANVIRVLLGEMDRTAESELMSSSLQSMPTI